MASSDATSSGSVPQGLQSRFFLYQYEPSVPAASLFIALFAITTCIHGYQMMRTRTWFFVPFFCGGLCETIGYAGRTYSASQNPYFTLGPYVVQAVLLLVAPALFAASIYMELGKISDLLECGQYLLLPRRWITRSFVAGDVICFVLQAGGASLMASTDMHTRDTGSNLVVGGLFVQIVFFGGFVITSLIFHWRVASSGKGKDVPYQRHLFALYLSSILIFARSIVRATEFIQGFFGYIISHEAFLFGFDAAPMLLVMMVFIWIHPSEIKALLRGGGVMRRVKMVRMEAREKPQPQSTSPVDGEPVDSEP
ncbi:RTA1 like protein-domain-containing protein [Diplogelasinospora grovesii]|uniref:RTA1 like protein-domain-containing protein n=1 Tax=Diplogelasinospora grovesii TaxID=303347 RepID=A0AAN6MUL0_9PEZI|nr:RTA1 like protein-domain-containing protein [Diplogelasinospora grovesii]